MGIGRTGNEGPLDLRLLGVGGSQRLLELPLKPSASASYAAVWDSVRARLLIASPTPSGDIEFWLVMLGLDGER
jgi:hypothetical protein